MATPLTLTPEEERMIIDEADHVLGETLAVFECFVANGRELSKDEWNHSGMETTVAPSTERSSIEITKPANLPFVITTGTLLGTVEDAVFGALGHTESLTRCRDALVKHEFDVANVLATIRTPTLEDPYRSLVVKWSTKDMGALSRVRDCVFVEATGLFADTSGNQVSYYVCHSIDSIPRLTGLKSLDAVRMNLSFCSIYQQYDDTSIEQFSQGFADTGGRFANGRGINTIFSNLLLSAIHVVECAYVKKLIWFMNSKSQAGDWLLTTTTTSSSLDLSPPSAYSSTRSAHFSSSTFTTRTCGSCEAKLSSFGNQMRTHTICMACREGICRKCSVTHPASMLLTRPN